eukprot:4663339-Amphidinium_carterae.1
MSCGLSPSHVVAGNRENTPLPGKLRLYWEYHHHFFGFLVVQEPLIIRRRVLVSARITVWKHSQR